MAIDNNGTRVSIAYWVVIVIIRCVCVGVMVLSALFATGSLILIAMPGFGNENAFYFAMYLAIFGAANWLRKATYG